MTNNDRTRKKDSARLVEQQAKPFLIENIGNYQREMIYLTGGKIYEMQNLILKLYGATPRDKMSGLGVRKSEDGIEELVYVGYPVDYWAIDWDYDGFTFKSQWQAFRGNGKKAKTATTEAKEVLEKKNRAIAIRVVDIFGNDAGVVVEV